MQKYAKAQVIDFKSSNQKLTQASLSKFSEFSDYQTDDDYLYVRVRAISSRVNKNHDGWPADELKKAYRSFIGKPIFVDHHNHDPKRARGVIVDAQLHIEDDKTAALDPYYSSPECDPLHKPHTWIELLLEVDAKTFPKLARAFIDGDIDGVSMGANVEMSKCSHCGNEASVPDQFCKHIVSKGAFHDYTEMATGRKLSKKSYENCFKISFFEISAVFDPADETALVSEIKTAKIKLAEEIRNEGQDDAQRLVFEARREYNQAISEGADQESAVRVALTALRDAGTEREHAINVLNQALASPAEMVASKKCKHCRQQNTVAERGDSGCSCDDGGDGGSATASTKEAEYKYVKKRGDKYVITQKGTGKVLSEHDSEEKAKSAFRAMEMNMHGGKTADRRNPPPQDDMITSPEQVDTMRQDQLCPICGSDMDSGVCEVCNYEEPPEGFDNPDLEKAQQVDEQMQQQQNQAIQDDQTQQPQPGAPGQEAPAPQQGQMPVAANTTYNESTAAISSDMTRVANSDKNKGGIINLREQPILPSTRQNSDQPKNVHTLKDYARPVESNTNGEGMEKAAHDCTDCKECADGEHCAQCKEASVKTADGASAEGGAATAPDNRVNVTDVGSVSGDPEAGTEHTNVEKEHHTEGVHTDTWSGGEGDSLGQHSPVTQEAFPNDKQGPTVDAKTPYAASAHEAGPAFPDHDPKSVDLLAPIAEPVGDDTQTWSGGKGDSLGQHAPITNENSDQVGGPIGVPLSSARTHILASIRVAELETEIGLISPDEKFERAAELEEETTEALEARLDTLSKVKTSGVLTRRVAKKAAPARMPSMRTASLSVEVPDTVGDSALFM